MEHSEKLKMQTILSISHLHELKIVINDTNHESKI